MTNKMEAGDFDRLFGMLEGGGAPDAPIDPEFLQCLDEFTKLGHEYDTSAPSTVRFRKLVLNEFRAVVGRFCLNQDPETLTNEQCFPEDQDQLLGFVEKYLWLVAFQIKGGTGGQQPGASEGDLPWKERMQKIKGRPFRYPTLLKRRQVLFLLVQKHSKQPPTLARLYATTAGTIKLAALKRGVNTKGREKVYVGKLELMRLIEYDWAEAMAIGGDCMDAAAQAHLGWTIGWCVGVRPGSLGTSPNNPDAFLQWKDITISQDADGQLAAKIRFRYLKGRRETDVEDPLAFTVRASRGEENLILSIPHRLLALAWNRGILDPQLSSVDAIMRCNLAVIPFNDSMLELPVFLSGAEGARRLNSENKPATSESFTRYLSTRAKQIGFGNHFTFYAWRRSLAHKMDGAHGPEVARRVLGHKKDGFQTLEDHYLKGVVDLDIFSVVSGEASEKLDDATPSKGFLLSTVARIRQDLNRDRVVNAWVRESEQYAEIVEGEPTQVKSRLRALKRQKLAAFYVYEQELIEKSATVGDVKAELSKLNARKLSEILAEKVEEMKRKNTDFDQILEDGDVADADELRDNEGEENEVEDGSSKKPDTSIAIDVDEEEESAPTADEAAERTRHFRMLIECFLVTLTDRTTNNGAEQLCDLCLADPYVSAKDKSTLWKGNYKLERHKAQGFHHPRTAYRRKAEALREAHPLKQYVCPFPRCDHTVATFKGHNHHLRSAVRAHSYNGEVPEGLEWLEDDMMETRPTKKAKVARGVDVEDDVEGGPSAEQVEELEYLGVKVGPQPGFNRRGHGEEDAGNIKFGRKGFWTGL